MPKVAKQLSERAVAAIRDAGRYAVGGVQGLMLRVTPTGARAWVLRVKVGEIRQDLGLGSYPAVSLTDARDKARELHDSIKRGELPESPTKQRRANIVQQQQANARLKTFAECCDMFLEAKESEWKNAKHRQQWRSTLEQYASPFIGKLPIDAIELPEIMEVLTQPQADKDGASFWQSKNETATRVRGRIEKVLDWATVSGYRTGLNPARWRGHLDNLLPKPSKVQDVKHHESLPFKEVPSFMRELRKRAGIAPRALELAILTAARSGEVRGMVWDEVDLEKRVWTIPAKRMKAGKEHRVPLSDAVMQLLQSTPRIDADTPLVFPSFKGAALSDMALLTLTRRMGAACTPHGFRSSFKDWALENQWSHEESETALAHTGWKTKVVAAYARGDQLDLRRTMMQAWADFVANKKHK